MRSLTGWPVVFWLVAVATSVASVSAATVVLPETTAQVTQRQKAQIQDGVPAPKWHLKFKSSGPVCMCGVGMSERDIEQAMAKLKQDEAADSRSVTSSSQVTGKNKHQLKGVAK